MTDKRLVKGSTRARILVYSMFYCNVKIKCNFFKDGKNSDKQFVPIKSLFGKTMVVSMWKLENREPSVGIENITMTF